MPILQGQPALSRPGSGEFEQWTVPTDLHLAVTDRQDRRGTDKSWVGVENYG